MDKVKKFLRKLNDRDRNAVAVIMGRLMTGNFAGLDVVKLAGHSDLFRARVGKIRLIFRYRNKYFSLLGVNFRSEKTYRDF